MPSPTPELRGLPRSCPYTIKQLHQTDASRSYVIREHDDFGEYPNIFAKCYYDVECGALEAIVLSDSGTGLNMQLPSAVTGSTQVSTDFWNIAVVLEHALNPKHAAPYILITTHCHYDHICGIQHLLDAGVDLTVLASSRDVSYLTPWENLQEHSLCNLKHLRAPRYNACFVGDREYVKYRKGDTESTTSIQVFHTPGHTPDSISWYDHETHTLSVGDMMYERESSESKTGSGGYWDPEPPMPTIFNRDSCILHWSTSMHRLLGFVRSENLLLNACNLNDAMTLSSAEEHGTDWIVISREKRKLRVVLNAAHVTIQTDAEMALLEMISFMLRIQLDQVPRVQIRNPEGQEAVWLWDDDIEPNNSGAATSTCRFSVQAPWKIIHRTPPSMQ